jgi:oxalate---CoA ligase
MSYQTGSKIGIERAADRRPASALPGTIGERLEYLARTQPEHAAFVSSDCAPLSYGELLRQVRNIGAVLQQAGLNCNARIAVAMPNGPRVALAIVAVSCAAVSVPVNPRQTLQEIERSFAALRPNAILLTRGEGSPARDAAARSGVPIIELEPAAGNSLGFGHAGGAQSAAYEAENLPAPESHAFILQTSGTASEPKLIPTSHRNMLAAAARVQAWFNLTPQDRCLSASPVFYAHGLHVTIFATLLNGGTAVFPADISKFDYAGWFEDLMPTWYSAGPALHRLVLDHLSSTEHRMSRHCLRLAVSGGAPLPREVLVGLQDGFGVPVLEHYGSSEGMQICANQMPPGRSRPGTCGIPWPNTIRIVGDDGCEVPLGGLGEILIGGPTVVSGYLDAPDLTRACFVDGWFRSGDMGSLDEDGFLTLRGRKTDLINRGGEKVSPGEVDEALLGHPAVAEAAAFSVPHPRLGEDVAAAVVLRGGMGASPSELRRYVQDQLASFKVPRRIEIRDSLPKGATGKVLRRVLTESWRDATAPAIPITTPEPDGGKFVDLAVQLTAIWERLLKTAPVGLDEDFFEKGGDSLLAMDMLAELDKLAGEAMPASILLDASTIRQLAQKLTERSNLSPRYLVEINSGGHQTPLIFFHGHFIVGGARLTVELTKRLGPDQPVFVIAPHGAGEVFPKSIEAMAAERLPLIMQAQPEGPYRLCGYCLGGLVAFETARMLVASGKQVEMVFLIDPPTINARRSVQCLLSAMNRTRPLLGASVDRMKAWTWYRCADLQRACNVSSTRRWNAIKARARYAATSILLGKKPDTPAILSDLGVSPIGAFADARTVQYAAAMSNYRPEPLAIRVVYLAIDYGIGDWQRISPECEVLRSGGDHYQLDLPKIAEVLRAKLNMPDM